MGIEIFILNGKRCLLKTLWYIGQVDKCPVLRGINFIQQRAVAVINFGRLGYGAECQFVGVGKFLQKRQSHKWEKKKEEGKYAADEKIPNFDAKR